MIRRFQRIRSEFGTGIFAKTLFLAFGLLLMSVFGLVFFKSPLATYVAVGGLVVGWLARSVFVDLIEVYPTISRIGLFLYGVVLVVGHQVGLDRKVELAIITGTTVVLFDFQFWGYSDPDVRNAESP